MKKLVLFIVPLLIAAFAHAETDAKALKEIQDIRKGVDNANAIVDLKVKDDADIDGDLNVDGNAVVDGDVSVGDDLTVTGDATVASKPVMVSGTNGSAAVLFQFGSVVGDGATTTWTQSFPVVYTSIPKVFIQPTSGEGVTNQSPTVASNQFTWVVGTTTNFNWFSVGPKP